MIRDHDDLVARHFRLGLYPEGFPTKDEVEELFVSRHPYLSVTVYSTHFILADQTGKFVQSFVYPFPQTELTQFISRVEQNQSKPALTYHGVGLTKEELDTVFEFALEGGNIFEQREIMLTHTEENTIEKVRRINMHIQQGL